MFLNVKTQNIHKAYMHSYICKNIKYYTYLVLLCAYLSLIPLLLAVLAHFESRLLKNTC